MKPLSTVIVLIVGVGCLGLAMWMGNQASTPEPANVHAKIQESFEIAAKGPHPKAVAPETTYDFGVKLHGTEDSHTYTIRNEGEAPLKLKVGDITCNCTKVTLGTEDPIPPGGETTAEVHWKIKSPNPSFRHSAKIETNDPLAPEIELVVTGQVEKSFTYEPGGSFWDLGDVPTEQDTVESTRMMYSSAIDQFNILSATCNNPRVNCTWEPMDAQALEEHKAKSGYVLHLKVDLTDLVGTLSESLKIDTDSENIAGELLVKARRKGPIQLIGRHWDQEQNRFYLGEFPAAEGKQIEVSVFTRVDDEVNLVSAESEHGAVKVHWEKDERFEGATSRIRRYKLKIEVPPAPAVQRQRDSAEKVNLKFDHPLIGTMQVEVDYLAI